METIRRIVLKNMTPKSFNHARGHSAIPMQRLTPMNTRFAYENYKYNLPLSSSEVPEVFLTSHEGGCSVLWQKAGCIKKLQTSWHHHRNGENKTCTGSMKKKK